MSSQQQQTQQHGGGLLTDDDDLIKHRSTHKSSFISIPLPLAVNSLIINDENAFIKIVKTRVNGNHRTTSSSSLPSIVNVSDAAFSIILFALRFAL
jgi:hypothetical protein